MSKFTLKVFHIYNFLYIYIFTDQIILSKCWLIIQEWFVKTMTSLVIYAHINHISFLCKIKPYSYSSVIIQEMLAKDFYRSQLQKVLDRFSRTTYAESNIVTNSLFLYLRDLLKATEWSWSILFYLNHDRFSIYVLIWYRQMYKRK